LHWVTFLCRTSHVKVPQITQVFTAKGTLSRWIGTRRCSCTPKRHSIPRSLVLNLYPQNSSSGSSERIPSRQTVTTSSTTQTPQSSILGSLLGCIRLSRVTSSHTYKRQVYTLHKREARRMGFGEDNAHHPKLPCPIVTKIAHLPCFETGIARNPSPV